MVGINANDKLKVSSSSSLGQTLYEWIPLIIIKWSRNFNTIKIFVILKVPYTHNWISSNN